MTQVEGTIFNMFIYPVIFQDFILALFFHCSTNILLLFKISFILHGVTWSFLHFRCQINFSDALRKVLQCYFALKQRFSYVLKIFGTFQSSSFGKKVRHVTKFFIFSFLLLVLIVLLVIVLLIPGF